MMIFTPQYNLHLEITGALIRGGAGTACAIPWHFGSTEIPYDFTVDLVGSEGIAILKGLQEPVNDAMHEAFELLLTAHEFHTYARHRHVIGADGKPRPGQPLIRFFELRSERGGKIEGNP